MSTVIYVVSAGWNQDPNPGSLPSEPISQLHVYIFVDANIQVWVQTDDGKIPQTPLFGMKGNIGHFDWKKSLG